MLLSNIQSILRGDVKPLQNQFEFKSGDVFAGNISKIYPNQTAVVKVGNQNILAKLEAPIINGGKYWFQASTKEGEIHLKILSPLSMENQTQDSILKQLSLPNSKIFKELTVFLAKEQIPLPKESILKAGQWIEHQNNTKEGFEALKYMVEKDFPFSESIYKSLKEVLSPKAPIQILLQNLESQLIAEPKTKTVQALLSTLESIQLKDLDANNKESVPQILLSLLKKTTSKMGSFYEADILANIEDNKSLENSMKPLLVKYLQETGHTLETKELAEQIINKMNGQQLLSHSNTPYQHIVYQLPLQLFGFQTELTMQWSGKRKEDGKIDPDYCHVLFYLELEHLKETIVDMKVQNRIISIKIINNNEQLQNMAKLILPKLKQGLKDLNYTLSAIQFEHSSNNEVQKSLSNSVINQYSGVDIRI